MSEPKRIGHAKGAVSASRRQQMLFSAAIFMGEQLEAFVLTQKMPIVFAELAIRFLNEEKPLTITIGSSKSLGKKDLKLLKSGITRLKEVVLPKKKSKPF